MRSSSGTSAATASRKTTSAASLTTLLDQLRYQPCPPCLMTRPNPRTVVPVKVLVKQDQIPPVWIFLENLGSPGNWSPPIGVSQENPDQAPRNLPRHLPQISLFPRVRRTLHLEILAIVMMELLQRLNQQVVHRHPDRPPPVRIHADERRGRFRRLIVHLVHVTVHVHF